MSRRNAPENFFVPVCMCARACAPGKWDFPIFCGVPIEPSPKGVKGCLTRRVWVQGRSTRDRPAYTPCALCAPCPAWFAAR